jgi:hypothetical protein
MVLGRDAIRDLDRAACRICEAMIVMLIVSAPTDT